MTADTAKSAQPRIPLPTAQIAEFCRRNRIRRLSLFGSVLRDDFHPDSDVDVLVEFEAEAKVGLMALSAMQTELSELLKRKVDLGLRDGLKPIIQDSVLGSALDVYVSTSNLSDPSRPAIASFSALLKSRLPALAKRYKVKSLSLFGSYVRNEQRANSDLDVLVEFDELPSLFEFVRLENELSELLKVKVDLVMKDSLKPTLGKRILAEAVPV